jgi:hypothetical protein
MSIVDGTKINPSLNYKQIDSSRPSYNYRKVFPANGGNTSFNLTSAGATQNTIFNIPPEVCNLGESYLEYLITVDAQGAGNYFWQFKDTYGEFDYVLYRDTGSQNIVENRFTNLYTHIMNRLNISDADLNYHDDMQGMVRTNALNSDVKSVRFDATNTSLAFKEPQHMAVSANNTAFLIPRRVYLKDLIKDSFFGMAKNNVMPVETYLEFNWIGNRFGLLGTSATDPTVGCAVVAGNIAISGLVFRLAYETNQSLIGEMKSAIAGGLTIPIPWARVYTLVASSAAPWVYNLPLDNKQNGRKIKKIVYAPFATAPAAGSEYRLYDHCNSATVGGGAGTQTVARNTKVSTYHTELDNMKLQRDIIQCPVSSTSTLHDDYMIHKDLLRNTTYYNQLMYNFNFVHVDKFDYSASNENPEGNVFVDGFDLVKPVNYSVVVDTGTATAINNVCVVVGQKLLSINASSFAVI